MMGYTKLLGKAGKRIAAVERALPADLASSEATAPGEGAVTWSVCTVPSMVFHAFIVFFFLFELGASEYAAPAAQPSLSPFVFHSFCPSCVPPSIPTLNFLFLSVVRTVAVSAANDILRGSFQDCRPQNRREGGRDRRVCPRALTVGRAHTGSPRAVEMGLEEDLVSVA
jgi:hypothetical protein